MKTQNRYLGTHCSPALPVCSMSGNKLKVASIIYKDEFKIEPRYAHKKNLDKSEKKSYGGPKLIDENNFTVKKPRKKQILKSMLYDDLFPRYDFFLLIFKVFLFAYHGSIENSSLDRYCMP